MATWNLFVKQIELVRALVYGIRYYDVFPQVPAMTSQMGLEALSLLTHVN